MLLLPLALLIVQTAEGPTANPADVSAQSAAPAPPEAEPDILISVGARADSVRWTQTGTVTTRVWATPGGTLIDENLSTGLPRPIPGRRTFRDVEWRLRAGATITAPETPTPARAAQPEETQP
ncbi:MAG TPA: hypothetical protein VGB49_07315 [Caulobacteraceae bacterium]